MNAVGIILSGGPVSVNDENAYGIDPEIFNAGIPILGICYGTHLIVKHFGGELKKQLQVRTVTNKLLHETASKLFSGQAEKQVFG